MNTNLLPTIKTTAQWISINPTVRGILTAIRCGLLVVLTILATLGIFVGQGWVLIGETTVGGVLLAVCFTWICLFAYANFPRKKRGRVTLHQKVLWAQMTCPHCGKVTRDGIHRFTKRQVEETDKLRFVCPHCGTRFEAKVRKN